MSAEPAPGGGGAPDVDVVVVTWNGRALLDSCLEHLARQSAPHRVIVVDNASTDGTAEHVRAAHPHVTLIEMPENVGFGRANNAGVAAGSAPYVVLVNNDVDAAPSFVEEVVLPLRTTPHCGAVAALTTQPGSGRVDQFGIQLDPGLGAYARGRHQDPDAVRVGPLAAPCAGAAAYRREAFEQVGGFDPALFAYSEDLDLGLRLAEAGWQFSEAPRARGVHLGGGTTGSQSAWRRELASFGRGFILGRYRPPSRLGRAFAAIVDGAVVAWGLLRYRTATPLTARWRGWRAARSGPAARPVPAELIDGTVTLPEALRRLVAGG